MTALRSPLVAVVAGFGVAASLLACRMEGAWKPRRLTGTCEGACDHYLACKKNGNPEARSACVSECRDVFQDAESLRAFESLTCPDAVEYVEGESGRGPGQMVGGGAR